MNGINGRATMVGIGMTPNKMPYTNRELRMLITELEAKQRCLNTELVILGPKTHKTYDRWVALKQAIFQSRRDHKVLDKELARKPKHICGNVRFGKGDICGACRKKNG